MSTSKQRHRRRRRAQFKGWRTSVERLRQYCRRHHCEVSFNGLTMTGEGLFTREPSWLRRRVPMTVGRKRTVEQALAMATSTKSEDVTGEVL